MCGIVGMAGKINLLAKNTLFKDMMDVCQIRGRDSAGVIKVRDDADQSYTWVKAVGPPSNLFDYRKYESEIERGDAVALIGHTRSRTVGDINLKNAHPFDYPDEAIVGVHNGTLREHHTLDGHVYGKVDSDILYGHLAKNGAEETFNVVKGAYACVWWDGTKKTLNFIRNNERPLWFTWSKDMEMMFWASEIWMFGAIERKLDLWNGVKDDGEGKYIQIKPHSWWAFTINPKAVKDEAILTMKPQRTIEPKAEPVRYTGNYGVQGGKSWTRDPLDGDWKPNTGGEVTNPFRVNNLDDEVEDILPWTAEGPPPHLDLKATIGNPVESGNTNIGNVSFMKNSVKDSASPTDTSSSPRFPKKILCLPPKNLQNSPPISKSKPLGELKTSPGNIVSLSEQRKPPLLPVSVREVKKVGMFIRDNLKGIEYSVEEFEQNTKGICCHCKEPVGDLSEVHEFINERNFICTTCVTPNEVVVPTFVYK